jgi:hypothetical protein
MESTTAPEYAQLVTVETFSSAWEAQLARACLEGEGIHAVIADEHFFQLYGALTHTLGGVRLQVRAEDCGRAAELLRARRPVLYLVTEEDGLPDAPEVVEKPQAPQALVTIGRFSTPWEAHLARTLLQSAGIDACVLEERLPAIGLLTREPAVMSRIEVYPEDAERALAILAEVEELDEASE